MGTNPGADKRTNIMKKVTDFYAGTTYVGRVTIDGQEYDFHYDVENGYLNGCNGIEVINDDEGYEEASDEITDFIGGLVTKKIMSDPDDSTFRLNRDKDALFARLDNIRNVANHTAKLMHNDAAEERDELFRILKVIAYFTNTEAAVNGGGYIGPAYMKDKDSWEDIKLEDLR